MLTPIAIARSGFIGSGQVGWPHHASGAVRSGHVGNSSVISGSIGSGQLFTFHVASGGLLSGAIGSGVIGSFHIASGQLTGFELGSGAIVSGRIASGQVGFGHLANASVQSGTVVSGQLSYYHLNSGLINLIGGYLPAEPGGIITLSSGAPYPVGDVSGSTNFYYLPFKNNRIDLWDGTNWRTFTFSQINQSLGTLTSGLNYDVFGRIVTNALTLALTGWTDDNTRSLDITLQDGRYCRTDDKGFLYLGTIRTTSTTTTEATKQRQFVANFYHQRPRDLFICPGYQNSGTANTYTTTSTTFVELNGGVDGRVQWVNCLPNEQSYVFGTFAVNASTGGPAYFGVGFNTTVDVLVAGQAITNTVVRGIGQGYPFKNSGPGLNYAAGCWCSTSGTATGVADFVRNGAAADPFATFLNGWVIG